MNKSERHSLIIGGSILGGLMVIFGLYKKFKPPPGIPDDESDGEALERNNQDLKGYYEGSKGGRKKKQSLKFRKRRIKSKKR